jgi:hypothetical protein
VPVGYVVIFAEFVARVEDVRHPDRDPKADQRSEAVKSTVKMASLFAS